MRKALILTGLAVLAAVMLPVLLVGYLQVGWNRMNDACVQQLDDRMEASDAGSLSVSYGWQVDGGFTCTFSDGTIDKSWWY